MIQGDENNIKITSPVDLKIASVLIEASNEAPKN
jgi:2-C-methyl-D-erythritol 4-phosphate cytidylyltransferase